MQKRDDVPRLLKVVKNQPHATDNDHEEEGEGKSDVKQIKRSADLVVEDGDEGIIFGMAEPKRRSHHSMTYGRASRKSSMPAAVTKPAATQAKFQNPPDLVSPAPITSPPPKVNLRAFRPPPTAPKPVSQPRSLTLFKKPPAINPNTPCSSPSVNICTKPAPPFASSQETGGALKQAVATNECLDMQTTCPTCGEPVAKTLLASWKARFSSWTIRAQQRFCQEHLLQSARDSWSKDYPNHPTVIDIEWNGLEGRLSQLRNEMLWLIERPNESYFRKEFERLVVDKGTSRTMLKHVIGSSSKWGKHAWDLGVEETGEHQTAPISVGYYGIRGLKRIMDFIAREFSPTLRLLIGQDRTIAARDVSGYIHMVLAPEMASRLIMEDMNVSKEEARSIMAASARLGDLLYPSSTAVDEDGDNDSAT